MFKKFLAAFSLFLALSVVNAAHAQAATCALGQSGVAPSATITFTPPTLNTDGTPVAAPLTYNLYVSLTSGAEVKAVSGLKGSPIAVSAATLGSSGAAITANATAYFKVSVTDANGKESALSNEGCKTFPASVPGTVTITIS